MPAPRALAPPVMLAVALTLASCAGDDAEEPTTDQSPAGPEGDAWDTGDFVTVTGTARQVLAPTTISLTGTEHGEELLVFSVPGAPFSELLGLPVEYVAEQTLSVQTTGAVREFDVAAFEEQYDIVYDGETYEQYEGELVMVADEAFLVAGQEVSVSGQVLEVLSPVAFELGEDAWDMLVFARDSAPREVGERVEVEGTVLEIALPELQNELGQELDMETFGAREGDVGLLAERVEPAGG